MKKYIIFTVILILFSLVNAPVSYANSAEPPSILIIVPNAPADLEISIDNIKARRTDKTFESYYTFYRSDFKSINIVMKVVTGEREFEVIPDSPLKTYNNLFTLNLKKQTLTPGKLLSRDITIIFLRVILTLLIEGLVFFLFGYRKIKSWLIFLIVNLITQGVLNILLTSSNTPLNSYVIFSLIVGEILVFIVEMIAFLLLVREHNRLRTALYVVTANLLSLVAGGYLITVLPV